MASDTDSGTQRKTNGLTFCKLHFFPPTRFLLKIYLEVATAV